MAWHASALTAITESPHSGVHSLGVGILCTGRCENARRWVVSCPVGWALASVALRQPLPRARRQATRACGPITRPIDRRATSAAPTPAARISSIQTRCSTLSRCAMLDTSIGWLRLTPIEFSATGEHPDTEGGVLSGLEQLVNSQFRACTRALCSASSHASPRATHAHTREDRVGVVAPPRDSAMRKKLTPIRLRGTWRAFALPSRPKALVSSVSHVTAVRSAQAAGACATLTRIVASIS